MEIQIEIMKYILENEPVASTKLAESFGYTNIVRKRWVDTLRAWGWITPSGCLCSTEDGRNAVETSETFCHRTTRRLK